MPDSQNDNDDDLTVTPVRIPPPRATRTPLQRFLMQVLWPAFVAAIPISGLVFSVVSPAQVGFAESDSTGDYLAAYSLGFILFWSLCTIGCALTWHLVHTDGR